MSQIHLRSIYEQELGCEVCDRTWIRLKKRLRIWDEYQAAKIPVVRRAAQKRRGNASAKLDSARIAFELQIEAAFPLVDCLSGRDLYAHICEALGYEVPRWTVYRWGLEINCRFSMRRNYSREHLVLWAKKLFPYYLEGVAS